MKLMNRSIKPVLMLSSLLLAMPMAAVAGKPDAGAKGGKPNKNSVAVTAACTLDDGNAAQVCSCKGLSNVVLWCGETWVKHEDFGSDDGDVYSATVGCVDSEGNAIDGPINMIAIKSGSQKNVKHSPGDYEALGKGEPSGSGLFTTPEACSDTFACPAPGDCTGGEEPPGGDTPDEDPPIMG